MVISASRGIGPVLEGDRAADPPDVGRKYFHQLAKRHRVPALGGADQRRVNFLRPRHRG
jgi:hypothetical protein